MIAIYLVEIINIILCQLIVNLYKCDVTADNNEVHHGVSIITLYGVKCE